MKVVASVSALVAACAMGLPASAGIVEDKRLPDGIYECSMFSGTMAMLMGNIRIAGMTYQGPAFDNKFEIRPSPYKMSGKVIFWKGSLGGLSTGGNSVASTVLTSNDPAHPSFDIVVMSSAGHPHTVSCSR